jgi:hypothetical protein
MSLLRHGLAGLALMTALFTGVKGEGQETTTLQIEFTDAGLLPPHWVLKLHPDGTGQYDSDAGQPTADEAKMVQAGAVHRSIQLSAEFTERMFRTARARKFFAMECESRLKVAYQGMKRLSYSGPDGTGACEYNYSKDKEIQAEGDALLGVANSIQFAARLEKLMQHDRLGMDQEMDSLVGAVHDGNAVEVGAIRETLERIANDEQILERVRRKARLLLAQGH